MTARTALRLARASGVPSVGSNVLAAIALAGKVPAAWAVVAVALALSLMYVAGMFLNDAFDRNYDREHRAERPIPAGEVGAATVFDTGFAMLLAGILAIGVVSIATGGGGRAVIFAVALATLIIMYNAKHRDAVFAPLVMAGCRAGVYLTAGLVFRDTICGELALGAASIASYALAVAVVGRQDATRAASSIWPVAFMALPLVATWPDSIVTWCIYVAFASWTLRGLSLARAGLRADAVAWLTAGIPLLDALWLSHYERPGFALIAVACYGATVYLQNLLPEI